MFKSAYGTDLLIFQVNKEKVYVNMLGNAKRDFTYMNDINDLKKRIRYAIKTNEIGREDKTSYFQGNLISSYHFVSSALNNPSYELRKTGRRTFVVKAL